MKRLLRHCLLLLFAAGTYAEKQIFTVKIEELGPLDAPSFKTALREDGAFAVTGLPKKYSDAIQQLSATAPECFSKLSLPKTGLRDGSERITYGTNIKKAYPACIDSAGAIISDEFDATVLKVAKALEKVAGAEALQWKEVPEGEPQAFKSLQYKEHIHVYQRTALSLDREPVSLSFHVDSGVLLLLTPSTQLPLKIQGKTGESISTAGLAENSIIFVIARGLPDWLLKGTPGSTEFFAAPHAVPGLSEEVSERTVFARMMVAPASAVPANPAATPAQFQNVFLQRTVESKDDLCPLELTQETAVQSDECADPSEAFCWMACMELPQCGDTEYFVCTNSVGTPCCNEWDASPPPHDMTNCENMDPTCAWKCYQEKKFPF